ncbi:MAG: energy-coupled thiamine transporter ThiT [Clostridiales bacterium]|nr:energy-coupled thiamine transporter ThiT [Clostridiales bacterium]
MFLNSLLATYAIESFEPIAKWLTIGWLAALLLTGAVIFFMRRDAFGKYVKCALTSTFFYLLIVAIVFFALDLAKNYSDSYTEENWLDKQLLIRLVLIPLLVLCSTILLCSITFITLSKYKPEHKKIFTFASISLCGVALLSALICIAVYYNKKISNDGYYNSETATVKQLALYLFTLLTIAVIVGISFFDRQKLVFDARALAYAGICASMSYALSYIKLWDMPQGGSVTLVSLLPIMLYSYIFGSKKGVFVGFIYGLLQALQDPWLIHPAQFLLDYPIAFSAAGLAGSLRYMPKKSGKETLAATHFALGATLAGTMRFVCHVLSGVFAFEAYAEGQNVWAYSLAYNSYVFIDVVLVIAAGIFVLSSKSFRATIAKVPKTSNEQKNA